MKQQPVKDILLTRRNFFILKTNEFVKSIFLHCFLRILYIFGLIHTFYKRNLYSHLRIDGNFQSDMCFNTKAPKSLSTKISHAEVPLIDCCSAAPRRLKLNTPLIDGDSSSKMSSTNFINSARQKSFNVGQVLAVQSKLFSSHCLNNQ